MDYSFRAANSAGKAEREKALQRIQERRAQYAYYMKAMNCPHHHKTP